MEKENLILRLISGRESLILKALDGSRLIYQSGATFKSFLDPNFVAWRLNKKGIATAETKIQVHKIVDSGDFMAIFKSLPGTWNQKWVSQNQIIDCCEQLPKLWSRFSGYAVLFLCKIDELEEVDEENPHKNLVVVSVHVDAAGFSIVVYRLMHYSEWHALNANRLVTPQLDV